MAYWAWGEHSAEHVVVCVHGLSRQGRDFDVLAKALCARAQAPLLVVCPDVVGRGQSDWLPNPQDYQMPQYVSDMLALLNKLQPKQLDWVGTSMGGLIGMALCGQPGLPLPVPVRRLILNDVGPVLAWDAVQRIALYLGKPVRFASPEEAADALWAISTSFGPHTREQWLALSRPMIKPAQDGQGGWVLHYDPAIAQAFNSVTEEDVHQGTTQLWQLYDNIRARTLLVRGAESDLLSLETAQAMTQRGPRAQLHQFSGVGHAPMFVQDEQVQVACDFLLTPT